MANSKEHLLRDEKIKKALFTLSIPAIVGMVVNALYNIVDTIFVGQGAGEVAIGALNNAFILQSIVIAFALMIGVGGASIFSRAMGAKNKDKMDSVFTNSISLGIIISLLLAIISAVFMDELIRFFGSTKSNFTFTKEYLSIVLFGFPAVSVTMIYNNYIRAEGRPLVAMISMFMGAGINIVLDPILIFGFDLGVQGAAIATVISQFTAVIFVFIMCVGSKSILFYKVKDIFNIHFKMVFEIFQVGLPSFLRNTLSAIIIIVVNKLIIEYSASELDATTYISIYGVVNKVNMFIILPGIGICQGLNPLVSYNYGAKRMDRVVSTMNIALKYSIIYFVISFSVVFLFSGVFIRLFTSNPSDMFLTQGKFILKIISIGYLAVSFQSIMGAVYQSLGKPIKALLTILSRQFIVFIPFILLLPIIFGINGIWYAFVVSDIVTGFICGLAYLYEKRKFKALIVSTI